MKTNTFIKKHFHLIKGLNGNKIQIKDKYWYSPYVIIRCFAIFDQYNRRYYGD